jgi:hypothetical protein
LAHRGNDNAILESYSADRERLKKIDSRHMGFSFRKLVDGLRLARGIDALRVSF